MGGQRTYGYPAASVPATRVAIDVWCIIQEFRTIDAKQKSLLRFDGQPRMQIPAQIALQIFLPQSVGLEVRLRSDGPAFAASLQG